MRKILLFAAALALLAVPALASLQGDFDEVGGIEIDPGTETEDGGAPSWCPPKKMSLLGVEMDTNAGPTRPGDYSHVAHAHPSARKRGALLTNDELTGMVAAEASAKDVMDMAPRWIESSEGFIRDATKQVENEQKNMLEIKERKTDTGWTEADKSRAIADAQKSLDETQKRLNGLRKGLAEEQKKFSDAQSEYSRAHTWLAPKRIEAKQLYDEAVAASKLCP